MASIHPKNRIENLIFQFKKYSRFKYIKLVIIRNGIYRYDIKLLGGVWARILTDPLDRIEDVIAIGYMGRNRLFKAINYFKYKIKVDTSIPTKEAKELDKFLMEKSMKYQARVGKSKALK